MGASGSGKSTCLNMLGCLDMATSGTYSFCGMDVGSLNLDQLALLRRQYLGFVFQGYNLLARTSALENVELPLVYRRVPALERHQRAVQALQDVGLGDRLHHVSSASPDICSACWFIESAAAADCSTRAAFCCFIWSIWAIAWLSSCMQADSCLALVAIARAIVTEPLMLLADEPTGNLDSARKVEIMNLLRDLNETRRITIVMVTHEPDMAGFATRIVRFKDGLIESDSGNSEVRA